MKSGPYYVQFLTWNTESGVGEGLGTAFDAKNYGGNFGHASVEISLPYTTQTEEWIEKYCRNLELYKPEENPQVGAVYNIDVPVYYTTIDGKRIFKPDQFKVENPEAEIVTHVYLSWVPGKYAAQRDERDPFKMQWREGFELYTAEQDKYMESIGHDVDYRRGMDGRREIEYESRGGVVGTDRHIMRAPRKIIHNLTKDEIQYFSMTPSEKVKIKALKDIYQDWPEGKGPEYIDELLALIETEIKSLDTIEKKREKLIELQVDSNILANATGVVLATYNQEPDDTDLSNLTEEEVEEIEYSKYMRNSERMLTSGLSEVLVLAKQKYADYFNMIEQEKIENFVGFVEMVETDYSELHAFHSDYDNEISKMISFFERHKDESVRRKAYPVFYKFYEESTMEYESYINSGGGFKQDVETYVSLRDKLLNRHAREMQGVSTDAAVVLPIANIDNIYDAGHPDGLNVESMLKAIPDFVANGTGYSLQYKNCSDFANHFGYAGAPEHLKNEFNQAAIGWFATPQVVNNSAMHYGNIIYAPGYEPGTYKRNTAKEFYLNQEKKVSATSKQYSALKDKLAKQDQLINAVIVDLTKKINETERDKRPNIVFSELYKENSIVQPMLDAILVDPILIQKTNANNRLSAAEILQLDKEDLKQAIYRYADAKIAANLQADQTKVNAMVNSENGLYKELLERKPEALGEQAVKAKMKELYSQVYGNRPFFGKGKQIDTDYRGKDILYLKACYAIIYENSRGVDNLTDPSYQGMMQERVMLGKLKRNLFLGMFGLMRMRMASNILANDSYNVSDPWFEVKWAAHNSRGLIDSMIGTEPSMLRTGINVARGIYLGYAALRQGLLIAPRRYLAAGVKSFRSVFVSQSDIQAASEKEKSLDIVFALESGKVTKDNLIKNEMAKTYKSSLGFMRKLLSSEQDIKSQVEKEFKEKGERYINAQVKISKQLPADIDERVARSAERIALSKKKERHLHEKMIEVKGSDVNAGLAAFESGLVDGGVPFFEKALSEKILAKTNVINKYLESEDAALEKALGVDLISSLKQFKIMSMSALGDKETEAVWEGDMQVYDPERHDPIIPDEIKVEQNPQKIKAFILSRIQVMQTAEIEMAPLQGFIADLDKMTGQQLKDAVRYLAQPTYVDQFKKVVRDIIHKNEGDIEFSPSKYVPFNNTNQIEFISFLRDSGLNAQVIEALGQGDLLESAFVKLSHDFLAAHSADNLKMTSAYVPEPDYLSADQQNSLNYNRSKEVRRVCELLSRGVWGDVAVAPKQNLEHDASLGLTHGKWGAGSYLVKQEGLRFEPPKQWNLGGLTLSRERSAIKASMLSPEPAALKNKDKNPKEIFMVFHEKHFEQDASEDSAYLKRLNFDNTSLMARKRHNDFTAMQGERSIQNHLLVNIREELVRLHGNDEVEPKPCQVRLTLGGEGLGGLDAQLMLAAISEDLANENGVFSKFKGLKNINLEIDLVTYDSAKASPALAAQTAANMTALRKTYPNLRFSGLDVQHGKTQEGLGSRHVLADVSVAIAKVEQQIRDRKGDLIETSSNSSADKEKLNKRMSNNGLIAVWRSSMPGRLFHDTLAFFRNAARNLFGRGHIKTASAPVSLTSSDNDTVSERLATPEVVKSNLDKLFDRTMLLLEETKQEARLADVNRVVKLKAVKPPIENLVFEGGGVKGTVYAGALKQMAHHDLYKDVKRVAGSSAGGIVSTLLAMGFRPEQIEEQMNDLDFKAMMDSSSQEKAWTSVTAKIRDLYSLYKNQGIYKGEKFLEVMGGMMTAGLEQQLKKHFKDKYITDNDGDVNGYNEDDTNKKISDLMRKMDITDFNSITFGQHHALKEQFPALGLKDLYLTATLMESGTLQVFSYESSPNLQIRHAARATMSFPGAFMPFEIEGKVYADGGIANNYPMSIFDDSKYLPEGLGFNNSGANPGSLGFLVDTAAEIKERWGIKDEAIFKKLSTSGFVSQLIGGLHNRADELHRRYQTNSIQIFDEEVPTMDLEITNETRQKLVESGANAFDFYADIYRNPETKWGVQQARLSDEQLKEQRYASLDVKYAALGLSQIEDNIADLDKHVASITALYGEYTSEIERIKALKDAKDTEYQSMIKMQDVLKNAGRDEDELLEFQQLCTALKEEIDVLVDGLDIIDAAVGSAGVLQGRLDELAAEKVIAETQFAVRSGAVVSALRFSSPAPAVASVALLKSETRIEIPHASEGAFKAVKKIVKEGKDNNFTITKSKCTFAIPVKDVNEPLQATIEKQADGKMGYFIDKVPESEEGMKAAFRQLYEVMFKGMIDLADDKQEITLNLVGGGPELAVLKSVLIELQEAHKADLEAKGITIKTADPKPAQSMSRESGSRN
jgi:predicted acylesterase/phospholipase RssA